MASRSVTLPISGMTCANCAMNIERSLRKLPGVAEAAVNFAAEQAEVTYDASRLDVPELRRHELVQFLVAVRGECRQLAVNTL